MTFYGEFGRTPTPADCAALVSAYEQWESTSFVLPVGYTDFRSFDSRFVDCRAWSLDVTRSAIHIGGPFDRPGSIPPFLNRALATTLAPIIYWLVGPDHRRYGRTYATGLTDLVVTGGGDAERLEFFAAAALQGQFAQLAKFFAAAATARQVILTTRESGMQLNPAPWTEVQSCTTGDGLLGAQRRRTRQSPESAYA
jgi:hypothetical protein